MRHRAACSSLFLALAVVSASAQDPAPFGQGASRPGPGVVSPVVLQQVTAHFTKAALDARIQGDVEVEIVVGVDGKVTDARVVRSLDKTFGLDDAALTAARQWTFTPGSANGQAVPVILRVLESFALAPASPGGTINAQIIPGDDAFAGNALRPGLGVRLPTLVSRVEPKYTREAMRQKITGTVELEAIVETDGTVHAVRVVHSLDAVSGLDEAAMDAARKWTFKPGTRDFQPVRVIVKIAMQFKLH